MEGLGDTLLGLYFALDLDGDVEWQLRKAYGTARMCPNLGPECAQYQLGEAVDDVRLTNKARGRVHHTEDATPTGYALQIAEFTLETSQNRKTGQASGDIGLLLRDARANLAQWLSERAVGIRRAVPGEDGAAAYDSHPWERKRHARRQLQRLRKDEAERVEPIFNDRHSNTRGGAGEA